MRLRGAVDRERTDEEGSAPRASGYEDLGSLQGWSRLR